MKYYICYEDLMDMLETEQRDNHTNLANDYDKYAVGYHNGLNMARVIATKLKDQGFMAGIDLAEFVKKQPPSLAAKAGGLILMYHYYTTDLWDDVMAYIDSHAELNGWKLISVVYCEPLYRIFMEEPMS